jgi:hypothetical protein
MLDGVDDIGSLLVGTVLDGAEMRTVPVLDTAQMAFEIEVSLESVLDGWRTLRRLADRTGRWPVAVPNWAGDRNWFNRFPYRRGRDDERDLAPEAVLRRAAEMDFEWAMGLLPPAGPPGWTPSFEQRMGALRRGLEESARRVGSPPPWSDVELEQMSRGGIDLDAALFEWEESRRPTTEPEPPPGLLEWHFSNWPEPAYLLLLPTVEAAAAPAYLSFYGAGRLHGLGHEALICILRDWHERFGAELVANTSTLLYLSVERPPTRITDAYALAREHIRALPDTRIVPMISPRQYARALLGRERWTLWSKP